MHIEIERKFLIRLPKAEEFSSVGAEAKEIRQTYLTCGDGGEERRIREIREKGTVYYVYTEKTTVTKRSRTEDEREITADEYRVLYLDAVTELTKTRYAFPYGGHTVEIDVYPREIGGEAMDGCAVMEVELSDEEEEILLPPFLTVLRELTGTREFSNKALARLVKKADASE